MFITYDQVCIYTIIGHSNSHLRVFKNKNMWITMYWVGINLKKLK